VVGVENLTGDSLEAAKKQLLGVSVPQVQQQVDQDQQQVEQMQVEQQQVVQQQAQSPH
jgi:hypothetical protein